MTALALSRVHFPVTTLGPGKRLAIWFQGCSIRCAGCISMDTWAPGRGATTVAHTLEATGSVLAEADGITVSGGEPFDQPEALEALLIGLRARTAVDILVFSGHSLEALAPHLERLNGLIDCLIADPFERGTAQTLALRGSDNQRLSCLTDLGRERFSAFERPLRPDERALDIMFDDEEGEIFLAGIPWPGDMLRLTELLAANQHFAITTEDRRQRP